MVNNIYSKVLENLETAFGGSSMEVSSDENRISLTSEDGNGYQYLDIILTFDEDEVIIEGCVDGFLMKEMSVKNFGNPQCLYDNFDDLYEHIKDGIIKVYGEVNAEIINDMLN